MICPLTNRGLSFSQGMNKVLKQTCYGAVPSRARNSLFDFFHALHYARQAIHSITTPPSVAHTIEPPREILASTPRRRPPRTAQGDARRHGGARPASPCMPDATPTGRGCTGHHSFTTSQPLLPGQRNALVGRHASLGRFLAAASPPHLDDMSRTGPDEARSSRAHA